MPFEYSRQRYDLEGLRRGAGEGESKPAKMKLTGRQASKKRIRKAGK
jgi:hypothetical protein